MPNCKVALVGAGSFVFGPSVLEQTLLHHRLPGLELALVDPDADALNGMAGVAKRMAQNMGLDTHISAHTEREAALDGADFVICCAAPQMWKRFAMDCEIIDRLLPGHLVTEFGGVAGISYSLRQVALIEALADDMRQQCSGAWLLNVSNPLPRVCQAAHERGVKTAGFCSVSIQGYGMISRLLDGDTVSYPFAKPQAKYKAVMAGVNHFSWLCELHNRETSEDVMPLLRHQLQATASATRTGQTRSEEIARETGFLLMPGDDHVRDFLPPQGQHSRQSPGHGSPDERKQRLNLMRNIADGSQSWDALLQKPSWERPGDVIAALAYGRPQSLHSLNLSNRGQIPNLPANVFVETACDADSKGLHPETVELSPSVAQFCKETAAVTDAIVRAARERSLTELHHAVELDPTIVDKRAGCEAIDACIRAHADLLPAYH